MATKTVPATPGTPSAASDKALALKNVAHQESNALFDVIALLSAAEGRMCTLHGGEDDDEGHSTLRLIQMARLRVSRTIDAFEPLI